MPQGSNPTRLEGGQRLTGAQKADRPGAPLVSIVTVVRNGAEHLRQTIESVLGQTYPNIEYIILDGGSTDGTLDIIRAYEDRLAYWRSEPDGGIYEAMNAGIGLCRGSLVGLKNADDWYTPHAVADVVSSWLKTGADFIYGDTEVVWEENPLRTSLFRSDHARIGKQDGGVDHRTVFVTRQVYARDLYDTRYRICADYDWYLRLIKAGVRFAHTHTVVSYKRLGGASNSALTLREHFDINRRHQGLWTALRMRSRLIVKNTSLEVMNAILRLALGKEGFARFKARKR